MQRWTEERAWDWHNSRPWIRGCNYVASDCINRIEQWQELDFEAKLVTIDREMGIAREIGYNSFRSILPFEVWDQQHDGFMERLETFLATAHKHGISVMLVLGNDCCPPKELYRPAVMGKQPDPDLGYHGGLRIAPHAVMHHGPSYSILDDPQIVPRFYRFVDEIIGKYRSDERVIVWDLFNEPGATRRGNLSLPHLIRFFEIARSHQPVQPLTACAWMDMTRSLSEIEQTAVDLSDVVSFHCYFDYAKTVEVIDRLKQMKRPLLNTEWLHRCWHSNVAELFPLFYLEKIGCYNWGLVAGKSQTYEPWEILYQEDSPEHDLTKWQHDLFRPNLRPYDPKEIETIKRFCRLDDRKWQL